MSDWTRRQLLGAGLATVALPRAGSAGDTRTQTEAPRGKAPLQLADFEPRSMLHVRETRVERSRFPVIDTHVHLGWTAREAGADAVGPSMSFLAPPADLLQVMDRKNIATFVNLTGGYGKGLEQTLTQFDRAHPGRFISLVEPWFSRAGDPGYPAFQADELGRAHAAGARGLKVSKTLGLYLRNGGRSGPLVKVDDARFDPMWEACGSLGMPVAIHVADPEAFFLPIDRFNERFEELANHPDWSFHGRDFPSFRELVEAFYRVAARHPRTRFIAVHVGLNAENLASVSDYLDRFPNVYVDLAARIGELGRQPRTARAFFERHQDRILFGTDAIPNGYETPQQVFGDALYEIYFRFLETEDEYFDYAPAPIPPQGRWRIYGVGLPETILRKVYHDNAARLLEGAGSSRSFRGIA